MAAFVNEEQWTIDGIPLSTWAYNIESLGGRQGIPVMAGENYVVPYRRGEVWRPKLPAARILSLGMWVRSSDANGVTPKTAAGRRAQFNENLRTLRNIFYSSERELTIIKNVRYLSGVQALGAKVECISTLDPVMIGPNFGKMVVDLRMSDPYWLSGPLTVLLPTSGIINNPGEDTTVKILIQFSATSPIGPFGASTIFLSNTTVPCSVTVPPVEINQPFLLDVENFFASRSGDFSTNLQNQVSHSGSAFWMELKKGDNLFVVSAFSGQGNIRQTLVHFTFYPVYL